MADHSDDEAPITDAQLEKCGHVLDQRLVLRIYADRERIKALEARIAAMTDTIDTMRREHASTWRRAEKAEPDVAEREGDVRRLEADSARQRACIDDQLGFIKQYANDIRALEARVAKLREALKPFAQTGWMTHDTTLTNRTVIAHIHPESRYEIFLGSEDFYAAARALAETERKEADNVHDGL